MNFVRLENEKWADWNETPIEERISHIVQLVDDKLKESLEQVIKEEISFRKKLDEDI